MTIEEIARRAIRTCAVTTFSRVGRPLGKINNGGELFWKSDSYSDWRVGYPFTSQDLVDDDWVMEKVAY
jgi:hypothetical protein